MKNSKFCLNSKLGKFKIQNKKFRIYSKTWSNLRFKVELLNLFF